MEYAIDFIRPMPLVIPVMQSDEGRQAVFGMYMDGVAYDPLLDLGVQTDVDLFRIDYKKPDGSTGSYDTINRQQAYSVSQTKITVKWDPQMLAIPGKVCVNIVLKVERVVGDLVLRSFPVILDVLPAAVPAQSA